MLGEYVSFYVVDKKDTMRFLRVSFVKKKKIIKKERVLLHKEIQLQTLL